MILCSVPGCSEKPLEGSPFCLKHFEEHKAEERENDWE